MEYADVKSGRVSFFDWKGNTAADALAVAGACRSGANTERDGGLARRAEGKRATQPSIRVSSVLMKFEDLRAK